MREMHYYEIIDLPIGPFTVIVNAAGAVTELHTYDKTDELRTRPDTIPDSVATADVRRQLEEYSRGERKEFDLPISPKGTPFQHSVWQKLVEIPYGQTRTYGELATLLGNPNASRAVGRANATNPISIIVPCHRVIGTSGELTGYAGGLPVKRRLLELEGALKPSLFDLDSAG